MTTKRTIAEIREWLKQNPHLSIDEWKALTQDPRKGVQQLARTYQRRFRKTQQEKKRLAAMWEWENRYWKQGYQAVAGVDEAGRGPLAGPVVAAAVILPPDFEVEGMNDSKKLTKSDRQRLKERIEKQAVRIGIGIVDSVYIDQHNILQATFQAMRIAIQKCEPIVDMVLVDALKIPNIEIPQKGLIRGDQCSHSIAAASIIAKTTRDAWMEKEAQNYPEYAFDQHKGYGTAEHLNKIKLWGPSPIHRRSFAPLREWFPPKGEGKGGSKAKGW